MSDDPRRDSRAAHQNLIEGIEARRRSAPWYVRALNRWFDHGRQLEDALIAISTAWQEDRMKSAQSMDDLERRLAVQGEDFRERIAADFEGTRTDVRQLRLLVSALHASLRAMQEAVDREGALRMAEREEDRVHLARFSRLAEETRGNLNAVERILRTFDERLVSTDAAAAQSRREFGETTDSLAKRSEQAAGRLAQDLAQASSGLADLQHRLKERTRLTDEAVAAANSKTAALAARLNEVHRGEPYFESSDGPARFDDFYFAFERRYRGTREEIARRQQVYLPFLSESLPVTRSSKDQAPVLDLGCGRGEWLGLLRQEGYAAAAGIDQSERMIEICHSEGLPVTRGEALQHLRSLPDASVAAVSAFHVVEHIPFSVLLELLSETRRVLMPGGLLLLETPNAENALVATVNFRHDPTHRHMIPPLLLSFAVEHAGFGEPTPLRLHPYGPEYLVESSSSVARRFNDFFFGAQDFGLVAVKP